MDSLIFGIAGLLGLILLAVVASTFSEANQKRKRADKQTKSIGDRKKEREKMAANEEYFNSGEMRHTSQFIGNDSNTPVL